MPGNVNSASTIVVLPLSLSQLFERSRNYELRENEYANGEAQRRVVTASSRSTWRLSKRLTVTEYDALRAFFVARFGSMTPFYFYDGSETTPRWSWDATGVSVTGRYLVRFANQQWAASMSIPRHSVEIELVEIA